MGATPTPLLPQDIEDAIDALEQAMPQLQLRNLGDMFGLANAWAERHDAVLGRTPPALRADVEARLRRIGIRWGVTPGARVTVQFPALPPLRRRVG